MICWFGYWTAFKPSKIGVVRLGPTKMTKSQTSAACSPRRLFSSYSLSPSSTIPGVTNTFLPPWISVRTSSAAFAPTGFELKLSSMMVMLPSLAVNCKRCGTGTTLAIATRISSSVIPHSIETAVAARMLDTLCLPKRGVRISAVPTDVCIVKVRPASVC